MFRRVRFPPLINILLQTPMSKVGRPVKFASVQELESKIRAYFDSCFEDAWEDRQMRDEETGELLFEDEIIKDPNTEKVLSFKRVPKMEHIKYKKNIAPVTITGLAVALDTNRQTLLNYTYKEEFFDTLSRAREVCEDFINTQSLKGDLNPLISKMNLTNNHSWKDEKSIEHSGRIETTPEQKEKADKAINEFLGNGNDNPGDPK